MTLSGIRRGFAFGVVMLLAWLPRMAAGADGAPPVLQEGFEQDLASSWAVSGTLACGTVSMPTEALEGDQVLRFSREPHLNRSDRAAVVSLMPWRKSATPGIYEVVAWVYLGNRTPKGNGQVSYHLTLQALDVKNHIGASVTFRTKRYNRERTVLFGSGSQAKAETVNFPVERWLKVSLFLDEVGQRWRSEIAPYGARPIVADDDLRWKDADFRRFEKLRILCSHSNRNDGMDNRVDGIAVRKLSHLPAATSPPDDTAVGRTVSVTTEPRHYRAVDPSFYNSAFTSWATDNLGDRLSLSDPETADRRARGLRDLGFNGVVYNGRHFRLSYPEEWDEIKRHAKVVVDACHRHGIKVIEHHDFTIFSYSSYPLMLKHLDWLQKDIRTGESWRWACPNNDDFINYYANYLAEFQRATNVDGYMLDEIGLCSAHTCGCDYCRTSFRQATGSPMPPWTEGEGSFGSAYYRNLVRWRSRITPQARCRLMAAVRSVRPDVMSMTYCSDFSDSRITARSIDLTRYAAMHCSFLGWENMIAEALNGWRPFLRALKLRLSYGNYYDIPAWSLNREATTKEAVYFSWALCQLGKHSTWYGLRALSTPEETAYFKRYSTWSQVMPHRHARCLTDTGLLLSNTTRFANADRRFMWNDMAGWVDRLLVENRQFDTLLDGDLELPGRLGKYRVLLLPSQAALSKAQCSHLVDWCRQGGTLVWTHTTSLYDEFGSPRGDFALGAAAGIRYVAPGQGSVTVSGALGRRQLDFSVGAGFSCVETRPGAQVDILAHGTDAAGKRWPAVLETLLGKGRMIYVAADLGSQNVEPEMRNRSTYRTREDAGQCAAIPALVDYAHAVPPPVELRLPPGVVGTCYQLQGGEAAGRIYIHLLNTTGKSVKLGDKAQYGRLEKIPLPAVVEPMTVRLRAVVTGPALVRTPERGEVLSLAGEVQPGGITSFTVPGSVLGAYVSMEIPAEIVTGQTSCPVPLIKEIAGERP